LLSSFWAITKNSFIEVIRQPIYGILLLVGMTLIAFSPAITMFGMMSDDSLMVDIGLATILLLGVFMSVFGATQIINREIESQTVGAIISKPVGRVLFVIGKFAAITLAVALSSYLLILTLLMTLRMGVPSTASWRMDYPTLLAELGPLLLALGIGMYCNYFYHWNFCSTAIVLAFPLYTLAFGLLLVLNHGWQFELIPAVFAERQCWQVARAGLLVFMGVWVLSSVALALSTRLNVVVNAAFCFVLFFVGMITQFLFGRFADESVLAWIALRIVPSLHVFWVADQLMTDVPYIPMRYVGLSALYAAGFCAAMVMFAAFLFERREVT